MSEMLPKGWIKCRLGQLVKIQNGYAFKSKDFMTDGVPLIKQTNLVGKSVSMSECQYLDKKFLKEKNGFILNHGDILIGMSGSLGKVSVYRYDFPSLQNQRTGKLKFQTDQLLCKLIFFYYFTNIAYAIENSGKGCGVQNISGTEIEELLFSLPPLNEQKRIVAKLDAIIPRIDALKARLEKIPVIVKHFRQAVLAAAVTGKLTEKWREEHIEEVPQDIVNFLEIENYKNEWKDYDLPVTWKCVFLRDIADVRLGKMLDGNKNKGELTKYLRNVNVRWFSFDLSDLNEIKISPDEKKKLTIENGDVFICEGGEPGRAAVWKSGTVDMTFQKALHRVRFSIPLISDWLVYNLKVDADSQKLNDLFTGSTIKHFTGRSLALYPIPLPPLEEQKEIVRQVDRLFALADKLEGHYNKAKAHIDKISQSVLAKAFRGELVPQDPNDEPAEKLLERIMAEKAKMEDGGRLKAKSIKRRTKV